jgi:hypothetical protein
MKDFGNEMKQTMNEKKQLTKEEEEYLKKLNEERKPETANDDIETTIYLKTLKSIHFFNKTKMSEQMKYQQMSFLNS